MSRPDLSAFQDDALEGDNSKPKARRPKRTFVLDENGEPMDRDWSPIPDWVACRLAAAGASRSAYSLVLALGRLVRQRSGENPTSLYERDPNKLPCVPRGHSRTLAMKQCEEAGVVKKVGRPDGRAPVALALWLPEGAP